MIREFEDESILKKKIKFVVKALNGREEKADDVGGVFRDLLSAFWGEFYKGFATGVQEMVPCLRHEFAAKQWEAVARIIVKGYRDLGYFPTKLSKAFIMACLFGEKSVSQIVLYEGFINFISEDERETLEGAIGKDNLELCENGADEDVLDFLSNHDCKRIVKNGQELKNLIYKVAHKELIQTPSYIKEAFETVFLYSTNFFSNIEELNEMYNRLKPTVKKVLKLLKPNIKGNSGREQASLGHLKKFIRSLQFEDLKTFLRFSTGADVVCVEEIEVDFTNLTIESV